MERSHLLALAALSHDNLTCFAPCC